MADAKQPKMTMKKLQKLLQEFVQGQFPAAEVNGGTAGFYVRFHPTDESDDVLIVQVGNLGALHRNMNRAAAKRRRRT